METTFDFSVVTAVYNVKPFLKATVQSLIDQTFGFSRIQLILIDDGSTDGSGAICDAYAEQYPDNVVVVHKENGGVSSARNEGLKRVQGKYVSFLDADDKLSVNAMEEVFPFFEAHPETDVVSIKMWFFDGQKGGHILNYKYGDGSRVIDLEQEPFNPQLAVTSAFVRAEALKDIWFDTRLSYAEDAKLLQTVLIEKKTLGVVSTAHHWYRRRSSGQASAIQKSGDNEAWYIPYLTYFCQDIFDLCEERFGSIPRFIQNTVAYDLQWRVRQRRIPSTVLDADAKAAYHELAFSLLRRIDDDIIVRQTSLEPYQKAFELYRKHGEAPALCTVDGQHLYRYGDGEPFEIAYSRLACDFFTVADNTITIECSTLMLDGFEDKYPEIYLSANGVEYPGEPVDRKQYLYAMDLQIASRIGYVFRLPLPDLNTTLCMRFYRRTDAEPVFLDKLTLTKFFPMSGIYRRSYAVIGKRVLTYADGELTLQKLGASRMLREVRFMAELLKKKRSEEWHAVLARLVYAVAKPFCRKPIWIISDRLRSAGDNGEALFRYLCEHKPRDVKFYYAITRGNPAYAELKKLGPVLKAWSWQHKMLFLLSDLNISSQADDENMTLFLRYDQPYRDMQNRIPFVFLQHGVIKDDLSDWLKRYNRNIAGFVTSAKAEADSIRDYSYFYPESKIWLTGLPRFDRLYHNEKRCITIMPTWRHMWVSHINKTTGVRELKQGFEEGEFYQFFNKLLNDKRLLEAARIYGYEIRFLPHPLLQPHMRRFKRNRQIRFLPSSTPYRDVFAESDLILTDYSSVAFDFAYLRKPVVYAQFDRESFYSGEHMYVPGYFDYERDGFGEVVTDYQATVKLLMEYMRTRCQLKDCYRARIDSFFAYDDAENCRRVVDKLYELQNSIRQK